MEWEKINVKITKNKYNDKEAKDKGVPIIHTKLYIMDCPALKDVVGDIGMKAFFGSANFTNPGLHENHEIYCDTTTFNVVNDLKSYFEELYNSNTLVLLEKEELCKKLYKKKIIDY